MAYEGHQLVAPGLNPARYPEAQGIPHVNCKPFAQHYFPRSTEFKLPMEFEASDVNGLKMLHYIL